MADNLTIQHNGGQTAVVRPETTQSVVFAPRVDILETEEELLLLADLPGVKPGDVDLRFENGELTLHGRCAPRPTAANPMLAEYEVGDFHRVFTISEDINVDKIAAELKNGVLTVHLPKSEKVKPKKIAVKDS
jgi:HSP20 family protein